MTIAFIHIPKTSGMSFKEFMFASLTGKKVGWYPIDFSEEYLTTESSELKSYDFVGGHLSYGRYLDLGLQGAKFCSVLRDPVLRVYSYYNHIVFRDLKHPLRQYLLNKSIIDGILSCDEFRFEIENGQCQFLTATSRFEEAVSIIEREGFILGDVQDIEPFLVKTLKLFGMEKTLQYKAYNSADNDYISMLRNEETDAFIGGLLVEDLKLYKYVKDINKCDVGN